MRSVVKEFDAEPFDLQKILNLIKSLQEKNSPPEKVIVVLGATSTGKTSLALKLAEILQTEIISADSMAVYKNFNVGTAKPSTEELKKVRHHLVNILDAEEKFSVVEFVRRAEKIITEINLQKKIPIVAGGTGLYIQALLEGYKFDTEKSHAKNFSATGKLNYNALVIGLTTCRERLYNRIDLRTRKMFDAGLVQEVQELLADGVSPTAQAMLGIGYKEVLEHLQNNLTLEETISKVAQNTRNFAKRQLTWFRRMDYIKWFSTED